MKLAKVKRLPNYIGRFGLFNGIRIFFIIEREVPNSSQLVNSIRVSGFPAIIFLRKSTPDHSIFWQVIVREQYNVDKFPHSKRLQHQYDQMLLSGTPPIILDCGGNIGLAAVWFANRFPGAKIITLEPDAANFEILQRNVGPYANISPVQGAVWNEKAWLRIKNPKAGAAAFRVEAASGGKYNSIEAFTIRELAAFVPGGQLFVVKLDIEGAQKQLFADNADWLGQCHLVVIELDDWLLPWQGTSCNFFRSICQFPYDYLIDGEHLLCFRHV